MQWTFTLVLQGHAAEGSLDAKLVLNETFHSYPMNILSGEYAGGHAGVHGSRTRFAARDGDCSKISLSPRS